MQKIVHHLKQKPPHVREQVAIFAALGVTAVVALFWIASLGNHLGTPEAKTSFKENLSPFKIFGENIKSALSRNKEELSNLNTRAAALTSVSVGNDGVVDLSPDKATSTEKQK